jgi:hypothetical protein
MVASCAMGASMIISVSKTGIVAGVVVLCLGAGYSGAGQAQAREAPRELVQPTGTTGATAFQPAGAARGEAEASTDAQQSDAGMQRQAKPGFDNKPRKTVKAKCHRPQGGVDASGAENIGSASKENTSCTGKAGKKTSRP